MQQILAFIEVFRTLLKLFLEGVPKNFKMSLKLLYLKTFRHKLRIYLYIFRVLIFLTSFLATRLIVVISSSFI